MNTKCYRRLVLSVIVSGSDQEGAKNYAKDYFGEHCKTTDCSFGIYTKRLSEDCFLVSFYDVYFIDFLSFRYYCRHLFRKFMAAIHLDFGVKTLLIVVKDNGSDPKYTLMDGTLQAIY